MEGLIGFVIFVIIGIASVLKRIHEAQQEEQQRRSLPRTRPEELPEATRRMLYGDTEVPTARERRETPPPVVIVARPRQLMEEDGEGPRRAPVPPVVIPPVPRRQPAPSPRLPIPPRPMQPQRPVVVQRRAAPQAPTRTPAAMPPPSVAREMLPGDRGRDFDARAAVEKDDGDWVLREQTERRRQAEGTQRRAMARAHTAQRNRLFATGTDLRRAIVMNEILGPPVALRDPFGPFQNGPCL